MTISSRVSIPNTDLSVYPLVLGANTFGWTSPRDECFQVMDEYWQHGGNFIDTADSYSHWAPGNKGGESEQLIGEWIAHRGKRNVIVATKSGGLEGVKGRSRKATTEAVEGSLKRLQMESIDLFYYHHDDESVSIDEQVSIAIDLINEGKIRYLGLSNYSPERMREFFQKSRGTKAQPVAIQPHYNLLHRRDAERDYMPIAHAHEAAVFPYFALAAGVLTGKYSKRSDLEGKAREGMAAQYLEPGAQPVIQAVREVAQNRGLEPATVALCWIRAQGAEAPIASVSRPEQLPALIASVGYDLNPRELAFLNEASNTFA
ncbi:predicted oxidoreductase [Corynebacterium renale]|uniref:Aryl-alcohol dehydrogenase-like predicted oxidoreductase n=1 Tax=Corynebacterium renale TaxID=1724 RepID=A0A2A9DQA4_9CORY|nr:aryl-alcohol dehydrogenase-like predicted oxidoreductase [Corynebacterium renale]SQI25632.1 predicted oxidoreductase [Corynebacterium renale]